MATPLTSFALAVNDNIKAEAGRRDLNNTQVGELIGLNRNAIALRRTCAIAWSLDEIATLAAAWGLDPEALTRMGR